MLYIFISVTVKGFMFNKKAINLKKWIEVNREHLKPPVANRVIWKDSELIVMVVGGPNSRKDYHINEGEELFYQVQGSITLKLMDQNNPIDVEIKEGELFLLPSKMPHSPQRPPNTVGLVIETQRKEGEIDGFVWYCEKCHQKLHEEYAEITDIVSQLPPIFKRFYDDENKRRCRYCGTEMQPPASAK